MTRRFQRGLVVGKFCPLHLGHVHLLDHAASRCEQLLIISYTRPEFDGCPPPLREAWLRVLYPQATVLVVDQASLTALDDPAAPTLPHNDDDAEVHRAFVGWLCANVLGVTVDAVFTSEDYGDGFAAALSVFFERPVEHVCVDRARRAVPVSGTMARADPHAVRALLPPHVYAGYVRRAVVLGAESSGKTTMAQALAAHLGTCWAPEFGRELWVRRDGALAFDDLLLIAATQIRREEDLRREARAWLLCDTSPLTTWWYSLEMFGRADPALAALADRPYDLVFLCAPDFPFVQDGTRRDEEHRARQHAWYCEQLARRGVDYVLLRGSVAQRVAQAAPYFVAAARTAPN